jgi:hypothetical protein
VAILESLERAQQESWPVLRYAGIAIAAYLLIGSRI